MREGSGVTGSQVGGRSAGEYAIRRPKARETGGGVRLRPGFRGFGSHHRPYNRHVRRGATLIPETNQFASSKRFAKDEKTTSVTPVPWAVNSSEWPGCHMRTQRTRRPHVL